MALKLRGGTWHYSKMVNGHHIRRSTKTSDEELAKQIAARWEWEAIQSIQLKDEAPQNLHAAIRSFLTARNGTGGYSNACVHMAHWKTLPDIPMGEIKLYQAQSVIEARRNAGAAHNTIVVTINYWNALQNYCKEQGWSQAPRLPSLASVPTRLRVLSVAEEELIYRAIDPADTYPGKNSINVVQRQDNRDLMVCLLHLGCRLNEAQKMRWSQIDFERNTVLIRRSKKGIDSQIKMSSRLREVMVRRRATVQGPYVFPTKAKASKVNTAWILDAVARAGLDLGDGKVTLHCLRHTFATRMLKAGMTLVEVQKLLGHKNIQSTMVYSHAQSDTVAERAAEVMDSFY